MCYTYVSSQTFSLISNSPHTHTHTHTYTHTNTFTACTQGAIRLQGGNTTQGRVEICNSNEWGTVCDDFWGTPDAQVACRQLGFSSTGAVALTLSAVPDGAGRIWLDNVQCRGTESRLIDCTANALGSHNCVHSEDAGVRCQSKLSPYPFTTYYCMYTHMQSAHKIPFDWWEVQPWRDAWSFATTMPGVQCVMTLLEHLMPM